MKLTIPQIPVHKGGVKYGNKDFLMHLHASPNYGSLGMKYYDYHERHLYMNRQLREIYTLHELGKAFSEGRKPHSLADEHRTVLFSIESLIYWLRKNIDELIGFHYYLNFFQANAKEPEELKVSSIGSLLHGKNAASMKVQFKDHLSALKRINDISNTFKHSFITSEAHNLIGKDEPVVNCIELKWNSLKETPTFHSYYLREIISDYVTFFEYSRDIMQQFKFPVPE